MFQGVVILGALAVWLGVAGCSSKGLRLPEPHWGQAETKPGQLRPPLRLWWKRKLDAAPTGAPQFYGQLVLQLTTAPSLYAFSRTNGQSQGKKGWDESACAPALLSDDYLVVAHLGEKPALRVFARGDGREQWKREGRFCLEASIAGDTLVAVAEEGKLVALGLEKGEELWTVKVEGRVRVGPLLEGDSVYLGIGDGLVAFDRADGGQRWRRPLASSVRTKPVLDGAVVYVGTAAGSIAAVGADSGQVMWRQEIGALPTPELAVGPQTVVVGAVDHFVYALERPGGATRWRFETEGVVRSAPVLAGATVYCASSDGHIYGLERDTGRMLWKFRLDSPAIRPLSVSGESLAVASEQGTLYMFGP